ncbi:WXG100 family type VII secretion target [Gordonia sp. PDNC005]|uniref:WXG100 family type VII secretion target n=1 Tax=unclassified Gordonia (in: high G+C Gram-positive bacteria) TaxID=2657482 RepID=UPI001964B1E7|nr:WXG100 family type VII secretion target [Gordonia sp. PDNC005]QRY63005.1 WXG100 family type VII secretion target [Gordonia sp. PDNC005]
MAEGDRLVVQPAAVKSMGGDLQNSVQNFTSSAKTFDSGMKALVAVAKGDGATAIDRLAQEWVRANDQITKALDDLGLRTEDAGDKYEQGRQDQAQQAQTRGGQMDFHVESI